jgi:integrase/recombinase XerD
MTTSTEVISPLRQRMIDDMRMRRLAPKTQAGYLRVVRQLSNDVKSSIPDPRFKRPAA